jgi:hypothetical protein
MEYEYSPQVKHQQLLNFALPQSNKLDENKQYQLPLTTQKDGKDYGLHVFAHIDPIT